MLSLAILLNSHPRPKCLGLKPSTKSHRALRAPQEKKITTILPEKLRQQIAIRAFFSNLFFIIESISSPRLSIAGFL
ncbi:Uncharacterized protein HZ326_12972 [Fusarium oxysporum f. sp. albedinis]|nr:Uncharacterized protein HZ326_12972 [Fusarium oxysporum f. sp. albedinis]